MTDSAAALLRLLVVVLAIAAVWFFGDRIVATIQAPAKSELQAARGNNAALKAGADAQNVGVDAMKKASDERKAKSAEAVKAAGSEHFKRAAEIERAAPPGEAPLERAANFLNQRYGPK